MPFLHTMAFSALFSSLFPLPTSVEELTPPGTIASQIASSSLAHKKYEGPVQLQEMRQSRRQGLGQGGQFAQTVVNLGHFSGNLCSSVVLFAGGSYMVMKLCQRCRHPPTYLMMHHDNVNVCMGRSSFAFYAMVSEKDDDDDDDDDLEAAEHHQPASIHARQTRFAPSMLQYLHQLGIDSSELATKCPTERGYSPEQMQSVFQYLQGLGVDAYKVIKKAPTVLGLSVDCLNSRLDCLYTQGLDLVKVINRFPNVLTCGESHIASTVRVLEELQVDVLQVVSVSPMTLGFSEHNIRSKFAALQELGLDAVRITNRHPSVLGFDTTRLLSIARYLQDLGIDFVKVLNSAPSIFGLRIEKLQQVISFLEDTGLDVVRIVNSLPHVLQCNVQANLQPKVNYLLQEMGRSPSEINAFPACLGYSLEARIRPRHQYLKAMGKTKYPFTAMLHKTDQKFVSHIAGTTLQEYYQWRSSVFRQLTQETEVT